jgi:hypothetical protein
LAHLRISQLDSIVLHDTREPWDDLVVIWRALEDVYTEGKTARIGVSHAHDPDTFRRLLNIARIKPMFVQNPSFAVNGWDREIRAICRENNIIYQAYSLNHVVNDFVYHTSEVQQIAQRLNRTPQQVIVAMTRRLGLLPLVGPQDPIKMAHALTAAQYLASRLTEDDVQTLENIAFSGVDTGSLEDVEVQISVTNRMSSDVYMAWQHPDHTNLRKEHGMHAAPMLIAAGATIPINSRHRHTFYLWDMSEGPVAPLYREGADKRWVRHVRADAYLDKNVVVVDDSFLMVVVNMGLTDSDIFYVSQEALVLQGRVEGGGGSINIRAYDESVFVIQSVGSEESRRIVARRANGDPQLLSVGVLGDSSAKHGEL